MDTPYSCLNTMFQKQPEESYDAAPAQKDPDTVETVVGPSVHVEGDFSSEGNILVKGSVAGNVKTSRLLTVEEGAKISANVKAGEAVVAGEISGNVRVTDRVDLLSTARVAGDISCKVLSVEAGALVHGKITMKGIDDLKSGVTRKRGLAKKTKKATADEA